MKLGYGGTKTEMERLIKDASKLDSSVKSNDMSFSNIVKAIHAVQKNMSISGISYKEYTELVESGAMTQEEAYKLLGTTAKEANFTITGSLNQVKGAWGNLLTAIGSGENLDEAFDNMIESVEIFGNNVMPVAERAIEGIGVVIEKLVPQISEKLPALAEKFLPPLIKAAVELTQGLIKALPSLIKTIATTIVDIFGEQFPIIGKIGNFFKDNAGKIADSIKVITPTVIALVAAFKGFKTVKTITSMFGNLKGGAGGSSGGFGGITNTFKELAKTKTTTVLKGVANFSIILGALGALLWIATKVFKNGIDFKEMLQVVVLIGAFGAVGLALSFFAGIIGAIPILTVVKGLANMAIVLGGMTALLAVINWALSYITFDVKKLLVLAGLMTIFGVIGAALALFAGIIGCIPIPVVLAGLANMALVLGGMAAIIEAFGLLSEIPGFMYFLEKGGQVLVKIMNILGEMIGAVAGGLIEGLSSCLPALGENLGEFGENIKPLFAAMAGVDMGGVGAFFTALVGLLGVATGNEIISGIKSFFGGDDESALAKLGTELCDFATNAQGFFNTVAKMNPLGFANAALMFECLGGLKSLPKNGGVKGWFNGELNYESIATGLSQLSSENVINFFNVVSDLTKTGFDNAELLFETLAGMKSLPKNGGVKGWFSGNINYENIAKGLGELGGEGVKNFFAMAGGIEQNTFENVKLLFETLAGMKELPKEGGFWQDFGDAITGKETKSKLSVISDDLSNFGEKTKAFFEQVNNLNLNNLNGLWESLKKAGELTTENISLVIDESISALVNKISKLPQKMGDALKKNSDGLSNGMVSMWKDAVKAAVAPVNKLLSGANHILKEFGSKKQVIEWHPYARGTSGHKGGNALVNDGRGSELIQMPNGRMFIPNGRNVFLPNAPKGMKVLPAEQTARLMGKSSPSFRYADGTGNIDVWSFFDNAKGLVDKISENISYEGMSSFAANVGKGIVSMFKGEMPAWIDNLFESEGGKSLASYVASKGVGQWRSTVMQALKMEGQYSAANVKRTLYQMQTESGGNPRAINLWDSNAKKGTPSKGLMQVIDPTFRAYARAGFDKNIYDPLSNILASVRYATSRYGSLSNAYKGVGYSKGVGTVTIPDQSHPMNLYYTPESSYTGGRSNVTENNTYAPVFNLTISGSNSDRATERKVKRWIQEAMDEVFDSMARKNPRLQEV